MNGPSVGGSFAAMCQWARMALKKVLIGSRGVRETILDVAKVRAATNVQRSDERRKTA